MHPSKPLSPLPTTPIRSSSNRNPTPVPSNTGHLIAGSVITEIVVLRSSTYRTRLNPPAIDPAW